MTIAFLIASGFAFYFWWQAIQKHKDWKDVAHSLGSIRKELITKSGEANELKQSLSEARLELSRTRAELDNCRRNAAAILQQHNQYREQCAKSHNDALATVSKLCRMDGAVDATDLCKAIAQDRDNIGNPAVEKMILDNPELIMRD